MKRIRSTDKIHYDPLPAEYFHNISAGLTHFPVSIIDAKNVEIIASANTNKSDSDSKSAHVNATYSLTGGLSISASASTTESGNSGTTYTNSHLNASNITIKSSEDTTVRGGVVTAENKLKLDVDGNLTVESLQDRSKNNSFTLGVSGGLGGGSVNGGVNANILNGSSKWVNEQTSLTGGIVDIDVVDKTTLRGAVINSTTGDLTLATGSFEYSNIKDRNSSTNVGGGASAHSGNGKTGNEKTEAGKGLDSASFGFSDSRQTNFATIGEGTIIVRDENADLSKLNRDVSKSQYGTMDMGVQLSADKGTIDLLTKPEETYNNTMKGFDQIADRGKKIEAQTHIVEKTGNLVDVGEFGLNRDSSVIAAKLEELGVDLEKKGIDDASSLKGFGIRTEDGQIIKVSASGELTIMPFQAMGKEVTRADVEIAIQRGNMSVEEANKLRDAYGYGNYEDSPATKIIKERTGWDGSDINIKGVIINQDNLKSYGMAQEYGACVLGSSYMAAERVSDNQLLPMSETYNASQLNGAMGGENGNMYINNYQKFADTTGANVNIPNDGKAVDYRTEQGRIDATVGIINSLTSGGQNIIRFDGHSVENNGAFVDKGEVILRVEDPKREYQFVDTSNMKLFNYIDDKKDDYGIRPIVNYRPVTKKETKVEKK